MKIGSFLAREEIRNYQDSISTLHAEIDRLRENGLAQAKELGAEIKALHSKLAALEVASQALEQQHQAATKDLEAARSNEQALQAQLETQAGEFAQRTEALEAKLKESSEEGELLLLQLHQVQEELESIFLNEQATGGLLSEKQAELEAQKKQFESQLAAEKAKSETTLAQVTKEKQQLAAERDALAKEKQQLIAERDKQLAGLQAEKGKADTTLAQVTKEKQQLAAERDALAKEKQQLLVERDTLVKEKQQLATERDARAGELTLAAKERQDQASLAAARQQEIDRLKTEVEGQVREAQQENELLLLQLHQVQEELEHYFLEHQKAIRESEVQVKRWQRLEARLPNYLDYEAIVPQAVDAFADEPRVDWRITQVTVGGAILPELCFSTFLRDGKPGLSLKPLESGAEEVSLVPRALVQPNAAEEVARFRSIRPSDWRLLLVAASAVEQYFSQGNISPIGLPEDFDIAFWKQAILPVVPDIRALPPVFRFERAQLKRELIHTDYEHLWLILHDVSYGNRYQWPKLELRLGASNIIPGAFSRQPKLELPRIDGKTAPFASWFEESYDDFGGKFELRFELNRKLFDVGVWSKLQGADQALVFSLIGALPLMLSRMQSDKVAIARPWQDWQGLANGMAEVLRVRLSEAQQSKAQAPAKAEQSSTPAPLAQDDSASAAANDASEPPAAVQPALVEESSEPQDEMPPSSLQESAGQPEKFRHPNRKKRHRGR